MSFACDRNEDSLGQSIVFLAVGSFKLGAPLPKFTALSAVLNVTSTSPRLPDWWRFDGCRSSAISVSASTGGISPVCSSPYGSQPVEGVWQSEGSLGNGRGRLDISVARQGTTMDLDGDSEYFAFKVIISSESTVGPGSCAGCSTDLCLSLEQMTLHSDSPGSDRMFYGTIYSNDAVILWQRAFLTDCGCSGHGGRIECPVVNRTWGGLKSVYR